jgi:hypothetical protein
MAQANVINLSNKKLIAQLAWLGYPCASNRLNICGLRGAEWVSNHSVRLVENVADRYNDSIVVFGTKFRVFRASVDPGAYYTSKPLNSKGCAHLKNGAYLYVKGKHRKYDALRQAEGTSGKVTVWRDKDKDHKWDEGEVEESGHFGINIHAGGTTDKVGKWSAGCQVLWGGRKKGSPWEAFMKLIDEAASPKNPKRQKHFRYVLIDGHQLLPLAMLWLQPDWRNFFGGRTEFA